MTDKGLIFKIYKELSVKQPDLKKWADVLNTFFQRRQMMNKMFNITNQENANQPQWDITSHLSEWLSQKDNKYHVSARMWRQGITPALLVGL